MYPPFLLPLLCPEGKVNDNKVIRCDGYKINAFDLEDPLRLYPGVTGVFVLPVEDAGLGERVAALLLAQLYDSGEIDRLDLADLRRWLAIEKGVAAYKLPTLLRVIPGDELAAKTDTGKPSKKMMAAMYFDDVSEESGEVQVWDFRNEVFAGDRAWDWA